MQRRLISAPGTTTDRWVYLPAIAYMSVREVVVMATCFSKNAKGPQRQGDPPPPGPTRLAYSYWTVPAGTFCRVLAEKNGAGRRGFALTTLRNSPPQPSITSSQRLRPLKAAKVNAAGVSFVWKDAWAEAREELRSVGGWVGR